MRYDEQGKKEFINLTYRIYSRISRQILDEFWPKLYQFDLYAG